MRQLEEGCLTGLVVAGQGTSALNWKRAGLD